jgi:D-3-phosphoglycerate dehydrogenase
MKSILITIKDFDSRFPRAYQFLLENGLVVIIKESIKALTPEDYDGCLKNADAVLIGTDDCGAEFLSRAMHLKILARMGSGMDNVDLNYAKKRGIAVTNSHGCNAHAVAEMTLTLMLSILRGIFPMNGYLKNGLWHKRFPGEEMRGKIVGLVGFGLIGQRVAHLLQSFDVRIIACDPYFNKVAAEALKVEAAGFEDLIRTADIISLHIPALPENIGMFNRNVFEKMKKGVYFINCARGALVDETALYDGLLSGKIAGAAADVFDCEPVMTDNPLLKLDNFIATPHIAGMTVQSMLDDSMTVVTSIVDCLNGKRPKSRIV